MKSEDETSEESNGSVICKPFSQDPHQHCCYDMENYIAEVPAQRIFLEKCVINEQPRREDWPVILDRRIGKEVAPDIGGEELRQKVPRSQPGIYNDLGIVVVNELEAERVGIGCKGKQDNQ